MKVAVILGHRLNDDASISSMMEERLQMTLRLYEKFKPDKIILAGGIANKTAGVSEASVMKKWLLEHGMPEDLLLMEDRSNYTTENADYSIPMAAELGADEIILCSSKIHLDRKWLNPIKIFKKRLKTTNIKLSVYRED